MRDSNAYRSQSDPRCRLLLNGSSWEEVIDKDGLESAKNGRSTHYSTRQDHKDKSVIDMTFTNWPRMIWLILADDYAAGSDYNLIDWEIETEREVEYEWVVRWNLATMTGKNVKAAEMIWTEPAKERAYLDAECTEDA